MRVKSRFNAEAAKLVRQWDKTNDGMVGVFEILASMTEKRAGSVFGDTGARLHAAAKLRDAGAAGGKDDSSPDSLVKTVTPNNKVVFEDHDISIEGSTFRAQPKLLKVIDINGSESAQFRLRFPVNITAFKKIAGLGDGTFDIAMKPSEPEKQKLPLKERDA